MWWIIKMSILKNSEIKKMSVKELDEKLRDLRMELIKERVSVLKGGKIKIREIKRIIARLLTFSRLKKTVENK